ncbi:RsmB/NOP family class I SAM-dependent RNA methyltransferase [Palleronia pelagia]|uniref:16S rRNA (Cytosine967-C5)-methyltransferase n=1 Tax=Palleronia pelagia TaxID=387096 RepID=A0A1H8BKD5_9RHOB|nr:RsmB/NOP family class I SAM-dependent RNA methyltransferase [Palleronia pelagia]SEM83350.1 16S rRNA (cytosine967-C5)-methyltransferase [Palleronia pelagia]
MTPAARVQTAIECLDRIAAGDPAERVLTRWARGARHAGSKDRAAVRDLVFDVLRRWWSSAARGDGETGRARMVGYLHDTGADLGAVFTGAGYGPAPLEAGERPTDAPIPELASFDCPPALADELKSSLGPDFAAVMQALRDRAPVFLRVNLSRISRESARAALGAEDIETLDDDLSPSALRVTKNARRVHLSKAFRDGLVDLQDGASQALVDALPLAGTTRVLDYCAGGGGKTLAMADRHRARYVAHDGLPGRMADLPERARRAGQSIELVDTRELSSQPPFDLVLVDAPCTGSGAWRRSPEGKIRAGRSMLDNVLSLQAGILRDAAHHVAPGGTLAYATCSLLDEENIRQAEEFLLNAVGYKIDFTQTWTPLQGGDGFFLAVLTRR